MNLVNRVINNKYRITEKIADGGMSTVWLAKDLSGSNTFVVKVLKKDVTSNRIEDIIRFRNEATTVSKLNEPAIAKIYEVGEEESIHYIVMEYLNGYSLQEIINSGRKFTIDESVEIIYRICNALKYIHSSGVLHRDIKPGNLIINEENSRLEVKLIDFGISQVREFDINDTREIVGTLYYMSPEQSGIINRIVDERSDLYSLGVVFYQLLAYKLPFGGENLNTIIHQHIARIPDKLTKLNSNIPEILEKIVSRLLEKEPENRYQSADGLLVDLEKFRSGELDFTPGQQDKIIKLNYRTNLVGRDEEFKRLKEMFEDSLQGRGNICFISGEAGKGKTRLTEELRNYVYKKGGIFVDGKCFSGENKGPYGIFSDVINSYLKAFIKYDEKKKTNIKKKIKDSIGELGRIILKLNPRAEEILDNCPELAALEPEGENKRFQMVVSQFFCDLGLVNNNGLVIFLDDLQWIDEGSIKILNDISKQIFKYPVFIICTYRDNEVHDEHILRKFIQSKIDMGKPVEEICLKSFDKDMMQNFISRLLFDNGDNIGEVSDFILKKSNGNPFFSIEILKQMVNENALLYEKGKWHINKVALNNIQIPTSIVDILIKRILELDDEQREILSYASVVGRMFDIEFLFELTEMSKEKVIEIIDHCIKEQFLEQDHYEHGKILFVHDRLAEAFYRNIGNQKKKELHFKIASVLSDRNCANIEKVVFDLAYHFIESGDAEKALQYVYPAALKSMENHASEEAIKYFLKAAKYLEEKGEEGSDRWIECIKNSGNISIFIGKLDEAQALFQKLLPFSKASEIKAEIYHSIGMAYFDSSQHDKAVEYMKKGLKILGEHIPNGKISVSIGILKELLTLTLNQRFIGKQNYIKMQNLRNEKNKLKVSILDNLGWLYMVTDTLNYMYIKIKTVNICQSKIGLSRELVRSLANMGFILGISRSFDRAIKYFENASELSKELNNEVSFCEVNSPWGYTLQWKGDYEESARKLLEVVNTYKKIGSYIDLITSYHAFTSTLLIWGELSQAKIYIDEFLIFAQRLGGAYVISLSTFMNSWYHLVRGNIDQSLDAALESCKIAEGKELLLECIESAMI
ncbi:MAG: protein kinase, partial [Bacillota bacterium]|nr:protein kinase [Bacillota bacterium]